MNGLPSSRQQAFEKPLFERACQIRSVLLPLLAASSVFESDPSLCKEIIASILTQLSDDLKKVNYKRLISVTPDPLARKALALTTDSAFIQPEVIDLVKASKKLADNYRSKKKSHNQRPPKSTPRSASSPPSSPSSPPSSATPPAQPPFKSGRHPKSSPSSLPSKKPKGSGRRSD